MPGRFLWLLNYVAQVISIWWSHISVLEVVEECGFQIFPTVNGFCWQAVESMPSWSFEFKWEVFDGVQIVTAGHVDVQEEVLDPYRRICCAVI